MSVYGADNGTRTITALELALDWAERVRHIATSGNTGPALAKAQFEAGQMAGYLSLVSIAEDIHELRRVMLGDAWREAGTVANPGAVDDARRTREHMRSWAAGEADHPGEGF